MAGNSQRRGAIRKDGSKKGAMVGSGGQRRKGLEPKGPTPKAEERKGHPAARRKSRAQRTAAAGGSRTQQREEAIAGRNAVAEALAAGVPASALMVLDSIEADDRVRAALGLANKSAVPISPATRSELDRRAGTAHHQGLVLTVAPFAYADLADLAPGANGLLVALDHITDPHNLGAITRSAAAFAADGVLLPQRRSAPVTTAAWKASAGALARVPVARVSNLVTSLTDLQRQGYFVIGLDGTADTAITNLSEDLVRGPLVLVVGAEGSGLARLTAANCDVLVSIPIGGRTESLNASVAAGIALYEMGRRR
jgi:23S rRNA (guanosine2251-2'-O)-methyltransferase